MNWSIQTGTLAQLLSDERFTGTELAAVRRTMAHARTVAPGHEVDLYRVTESGLAGRCTMTANRDGVVRRAQRES